MLCCCNMKRSFFVFVLVVVVPFCLFFSHICAYIHIPGTCSTRYCCSTRNKEHMIWYVVFVIFIIPFLFCLRSVCFFVLFFLGPVPTSRHDGADAAATRHVLRCRRCGLRGSGSSRHANAVPHESPGAARGLLELAGTLRGLRHATRPTGARQAYREYDIIARVICIYTRTDFLLKLDTDYLILLLFCGILLLFCGNTTTLLVIFPELCEQHDTYLHIYV